MIGPVAYEKILLILLVTQFAIGVGCLLLRRMAAWCLVGQVIALKAVVACGFLLAYSGFRGTVDLLFASLVCLSIVPVATAVGILVIHRSGRFSGTSDFGEERRLKQ